MFRRKRRPRDPNAKPRKKKAVVEDDDEETDDEVEEVKERKMANEETNCIKVNILKGLTAPFSSNAAPHPFF